MVQHHINEELCAVSIAFPLFCSTPVHTFGVYEFMKVNLALVLKLTKHIIQIKDT
jgi:hypothetical protein